jgi:hypothetical protein
MQTPRADPELGPRITKIGGSWDFAFEAGSERGDTGSHYTPDEHMQKPVRAGIDPAIEEALAGAGAKAPAGEAYAAATEADLLFLHVLDSACGSGHMLLGAARAAEVRQTLMDWGMDLASCERRAALMLEINLGLTKTYDLFQTPPSTKPWSRKH